VLTCDLAVNVKNVVSSVEIFNSKKVKVFVEESCPGISVDRSHGVEIHLSRAVAQNPPHIVTSGATEVQFVIPGKTDKDPEVYIPLPERFMTKLKDGRITTEGMEA